MADAESDFLAKLRSADAKQRLDALAILVPDDAPFANPIYALLPASFRLFLEINPLALKKLYTALEELLRQDMLDANQFQSIATVLIERASQY